MTGPGADGSMTAMGQEDLWLDRVRLALGRRAALAGAPVPPAIAEPLTRLVHTDIGLAELFARRAADNAMLVSRVRGEELAGQVVAAVREAQCRRIGLSAGATLAKWDLLGSLRGEGFDARTWDQLTLQEAYELDCGVTDVSYAVAETGSLVIRPEANHGRALSLVPPVHMAIVEPAMIVGDLLDLFERLAREARGQNVVIVTGPSKTADIEMNLVTGVHGPGTVRVFLLE